MGAGVLALTGEVILVFAGVERGAPAVKSHLCPGCPWAGLSAPVDFEVAVGSCGSKLFNVGFCGCIVAGVVLVIRLESELLDVGLETGAPTVDSHLCPGCP